MLSESANHIEVQTESHYLADKSCPEENRYVFAYHVKIINNGQSSAKLVNRHWVITDSNGKSTQVRGDGVVGEQPTIRPGEHYEYTSGTILKTPVGTMYGHYQMISPEGQQINANIAPFCLANPMILN